ncbi:MAG TPA: LptA/OstA family protein, partial [Verrucomicrobiae bacterium]|nr:LptA/OstA family protein [Verrucomicrobiae bacterium]
MKTFWFVMLITSIGVVLNAQTNAPVSETNMPPAVTPSTNAPTNVSPATNSVKETNSPPGISSTNNSSHGIATLSEPFTTIRSKKGYFDLKSRVAIYRGDVRVKDPQLNMTCDELTVYLPSQTGGRPNKIVADKHVVIDFTDQKGQTRHAVADHAVYTYDITGSETNELVTLT